MPGPSERLQAPGLVGSLQAANVGAHLPSGRDRTAHDGLGGKRGKTFAFAASTRRVCYARCTTLRGEFYDELDTDPGTPMHGTRTSGDARRRNIDDRRRFDGFGD